MSKYANNQEFYQKAPNPIGEGISKGLEEAMRIQDRRSVEHTLNDPKATPIQKAIAASKIDPKLSAAILKQSSLEQEQSRIAAKYGRTPNIDQGFNKQIPNSSQLQDQLSQIQNYQSGQQQNPQQLQQQEAPVNQPMPVPQQQNVVQQPQITPGEILETSVINPQLGRTLSDVAKMQQKEVHLQRQEEREVRRDTQKYVDKILDSYQGAKTSEAILGQMQKLSSEGDLTSPVMNTLLNKAGIPLGTLNNPDSEEFDKLANTLTRDIQKFYGSRILQSEFQNFLKQIPTLNNSPEGRQRIIENLQRMFEPAKLEYEAYKQVVKENSGKRPEDLRERIAEKMEPVLDKWAEEFKNATSKVNPEKVPGGTLIVISPDGRRVAVPKDRISEALSQGGRLE